VVPQVLESVDRLCVTASFDVPLDGGQLKS
jgi:hypothetical protein